MKRILENGEEHHLVLTKGEDSKPRLLAWVNAEGKQMEVIWEQGVGIPVKDIFFDSNHGPLLP